MITRLKENHNFCPWILLNFAIAFMLCVFAPIDAYYANTDEYWFSLGQMLPVCFITFLIVLVLLSFFSFLISRTKANTLLLTISFTLFIVLYIQGNFIPRNYGVLNGEAVKWDSYTNYAIASICLLVFGLLFICFINSKMKQHLPTIAKYTSLFIFSIQVVTITTIMIQTGIPADKKGEVLVTTQKDLLNLSEDNNVIVFLLDTYESADLDYVLQNSTSDQSAIFSGFTYYRDTLGAYPTTKAALPQILTGRWYENEKPYREYIKDAYNNNTIYNAFKEQDYELDIYTETMFLSDDITSYNNLEIGTYTIKNPLQFAGKLYKLIAFNYMPHQLKKYFSIETEEFSDFKTANTEDPIFSFDVIKFANELEKKGLTVSRHGNVLKFYHLYGVHGPYTFGAELKEDKNANYTSYDEAAGNNELLKRYFNALKEAGLYDQSTIIIMADHGHTQYCQNPIFLIKNAGETHNLSVSNEKMSYEFLKDIWIALIEGQTVDEAFIANLASVVEPRRYLYYTWDDAWQRQYMPAMIEYSCSGAAYTDESLIPSGKYYYPEGENRAYSLGDTIDFIDGRTAYNYVLYGFSYGYAMENAKLVFDINGQFDDICVEIELAETSIPKVMEVYANDRIVAKQGFAYCANKPVEIVIPGNYIQGGHIELEFKSSDNSSNAALSESGIRFNTLRIKPVNQEFSVKNPLKAYQYKFGDTIVFNKENIDYSNYVLSGLYYAEEWGAWTSGNNTKLRFASINTGKDLVLDLEYETFNHSQHVEIICNDQIIADYIANGIESKSFRIPAELAGETLDINIILPDAVSPSALGISDDMRKLALGLHAITIDVDE